MLQGEIGNVGPSATGSAVRRFGRDSPVKRHRPACRSLDGRASQDLFSLLIRSTSPGTISLRDTSCGWLLRSTHALLGRRRWRACTARSALYS